MSENLYAEPAVIKREDDKDSIVDIYVSAESLRVFDNPWVEDTSPNRPASPQHPVSVVSENSGRTNHIRSDSVFLGAVCLLLLAGIICLGVQMKKDKANWRNQSLEDIHNLRKICDQLKANNTELSRERDDVWEKLCGKKPDKGKSLDWSDYP